jgi:Superfamily I DNA and RNA helicases
VEIIRSPQDTEEVSQDYQDFLAIAEEFQSINDYLTAFATDRERFVQFYKSDYVECPIPTDEGFLTLSTIHSAKGLEWNNVFIMGLCEGNFPNPYFCKAKSPQEEDEFFNNEWKKMYVASTRARESLVLSYATVITRKGFTFRKDPSRFINT